MKNGIQELDDMANDNCTHWWIIDSDNVGRCKFCGEVRDFGKSQRHESKLLGLKSESGGTRSKRSAAAEKRWQNPEYQAKKSAAAKKRWQDPEYQAKQSAAMKGRRHKKEELL